MRYLLDTSVCVAVLRGQPGVIDRLTTIEPSVVAVSTITIAELWHGVLKSRAPESTGMGVRRFLEPLTVLPFDENAAMRHAASRRALEIAGTPIGERDLIIAATALANESAVATQNVGEFARVPDLVVERWP